jgi:hypothetical protein
MLLYLGVAGAVYAFYRVTEVEKLAMQIGLWGVLPVCLFVAALGGESWARRALAVVWLLHGALHGLFAQSLLAKMGEQMAITWGDVLVPLGQASVSVLAAALVLIQRDIRALTFLREQRR